MTKQISFQAIACSTLLFCCVAIFLISPRIDRSVDLHCQLGETQDQRIVVFDSAPPHEVIPGSVYPVLLPGSVELNGCLTVEVTFSSSGGADPTVRVGGRPNTSEPKIIWIDAINHFRSPGKAFILLLAEKDIGGSEVFEEYAVTVAASSGTAVGLGQIDVSPTTLRQRIAYALGLNAVGEYWRLSDLNSVQSIGYAAYFLFLCSLSLLVIALRKILGRF